MKHVFLHGLGQDPASWDEVVRAMGLGDEALCPGLLSWLRGREIAYSNLYKALEEYCGTLERPLNLCGLSLGGELALEYAIKHPERVNACADWDPVCIAQGAAAPSELAVPPDARLLLSGDGGCPRGM